MGDNGDVFPRPPIFHARMLFFRWPAAIWSRVVPVRPLHPRLV